MARTLILAFGLFAAVPSAFADLTNLCILLEGVPMPFCRYTRYHTCNSGVAERCVYAKMDYMVDTIADPSTGRCADNQMVCTDNCTKGPDGTVCERTCKCRDDVPVVTDCRTLCRKCVSAGAIIDTGVECPRLCNEPAKCPGSIVQDGQVYKIKGPNDSNCSSDKLCSPPLNDVGGPKSRAECPAINEPPGGGSLGEGCCFRGSGDNRFGAPPCP